MGHTHMGLMLAISCDRVQCEVSFSWATWWQDKYITLHHALDTSSWHPTFHWGIGDAASATLWS